MPSFLGGKSLFSLLSTSDIAEDDLTFLRWGCSEAKNNNEDNNWKTEKEVTKKRVAKKSEPECRGIGKEAQNSTEQCREYSESRAWENTEQCREAKLTRAIESRRNTRQIDPEDCRCCAAVQEKSHDIIRWQTRELIKRVYMDCMFWGITNSKQSGKKCLIRWSIEKKLS